MDNMDGCPSLASGLVVRSSSEEEGPPPGPIEAMRDPSVKVIIEKPTQAKSLKRSLYWYGMGRTDRGVGVGVGGGSVGGGETRAESDTTMLRQC